MTEQQLDERDADDRRRLRIQLSIDPDLWTEFRSLAEQNHRPYSYEVEVAMKAHLERERQQREDRKV